MDNCAFVSRNRRRFTVLQAIQVLQGVKSYEVVVEAWPPIMDLVCSPTLAGGRDRGGPGSALPVR
jgi:hypothetical protein